MTLSELSYIVALAQTKHFGKAAKLCHVSQPSLSHAIKKIETELDVALFERKSREVSVTPVGEKMVAKAQTILDEITAFKGLAQSHHSQLNEPLKLGAILSVGPYLFPYLIPQLNKLAPDMPLILDEDYTKNLRDKLNSGELDAIFIALPFQEQGVVTHALYDEPFVVVMPKSHPLTKKSIVLEKDLQNETLLLLGEGHCFRSQVLEVCPSCYNRAAMTQNIIEGTSIETLRHMVASGLGVTILPSSALQNKQGQKNVVTRPFTKKPPTRTIALAWRISFPRTKAITQVLAATAHSKLTNVCLLP